MSLLTYRSSQVPSSRRRTIAAVGPLDMDLYSRRQLVKSSLKLGLDILKEAADALPGPAKALINVAHRIVTMSEVSRPCLLGRTIASEPHPPL